MESVSAALASTAVTEQLTVLQAQLTSLEQRPTTSPPQHFDMCTQITPIHFTNAAQQCTSPELRTAATALQATQRRINFHQANASAQCNLNSPLKNATHAAQHAEQGTSPDMPRQPVTKQGPAVQCPAANMLEQLLRDKSADGRRHANYVPSHSRYKASQQCSRAQRNAHAADRTDAVDMEPAHEDIAGEDAPAYVEEQNSCNVDEALPALAPPVRTHAKAAPAQTKRKRPSTLHTTSKQGTANAKATKGHAQAAAAQHAAEQHMWQPSFPELNEVWRRAPYMHVGQGMCCYSCLGL